MDPRWKNPQGTKAEQISQWAQDITRELRKGITAEIITYDNTTSGLTADDVQAAIDELAALSARIDAVFGSTRGSILHRYNTLWDILPPGDEGEVLTAHGAGADLTYEAGGIETIIAAAPNSSHDVSEITAVTIFTVNVPNVAVGDQIKVEIDYTVLNDSAANRVYTRRIEFGGIAAEFEETALQTPDDTGHEPRREVARLAVSAADHARMVWVMEGFGGAVDGPDPGLGGARAGATAWDFDTGDFTGTVAVTFKFFSASATATQTLVLHSYKITKTPTT